MADAFYNKTVTIWNKYVNGLWEKEVWLPTVVKNVRLLVSRGNNIQTSGNTAADSARLHISDKLSTPDKPYLPPETWRSLEDAEKANYFTLDSENDSFFVEGNTSAVDASAQAGFFAYMKKKYPNCFKITSADRFEIIPHFEVWGK